MNIFKRFRILPTLATNAPIIVVFAGGMGTQILQAAVYFAAQKAGRVVFADLSYFKTPRRIAQVGNKGQLTHWYWQLDHFGLPQSSFNSADGMDVRYSDVVRDGPRMLELGLQALADSGIRGYFKDCGEIGDTLSPGVVGRFLCVHIRRGDYVNVASRLVSNEDFIHHIKKYSGLIENLVVLSDSAIEATFQDAISSYFKQAMFLDNTDSLVAHRIMRCAKILVCSNSTFSLTAATMNPNALIIVPRKWFGDGSEELELPIHSRCSFQILEST